MKLEEIRQWLRGEDVKGLPKHKLLTKEKVDDGRIQKCPDCGGVGVDIFGDKCSTCGGLKKVPKQRILECSNCYGTGEEPFTGEVCELCGGKGVFELPAEKKNGLVEKIKKKKKSSGRYSINSDGSDAILKFGKHKGRSLRQIVERGSASYLEYIIRETFPDDLKDICRYVLTHPS